MFSLDQQTQFKSSFLLPNQIQQLNTSKSTTSFQHQLSSNLNSNSSLNNSNSSLNHSFLNSSSSLNQSFNNSNTSLNYSNNYSTKDDNDDDDDEDDDEDDNLPLDMSKSSKTKNEYTNDSLIKNTKLIKDADIGQYINKIISENEAIVENE